jgi:hypothetical protein
MLSKPFLARCNDRASMPKVHPKSATPEEWYSNDILISNDLFGISFDFFVNWSAKPPSITPVIWVKRILDPAHNYQDAIEHMIQIMEDEFGAEYLNRLSDFASNYGLQVQFIIYRDDFNWDKDESQILMVTFSKNEAGNIVFTPEIVSIVQFKAIIQQHSGGPINIGQKGLMYGTSNLECHLSHTDSLYPGDVDLVLLNPNNLAKGVMEFKKHTLASSISNQQLSNYYPQPDGRKYNRLEILKEFLSTPEDYIPFFVLYYPTNAAFTDGRLELLQGITGNLSTRAGVDFPLPTANNVQDYQRIIDQLKRAIVYHYGQN